MVCPPEFWCISKVEVADAVVGMGAAILFVLLIIGVIAISLSPANKDKK